MKEKEMKRQIKMTGAAIVDIGRLGASLEKPFITFFSAFYVTLRYTYDASTTK